MNESRKESNPKKNHEKSPDSDERSTCFFVCYMRHKAVSDIKLHDILAAHAQEDS